MLKMKENEIVEENLYSLSYDYLNTENFKLQNQLYKGEILGEYYVNISLEGSKNNDVTSLISANRRQTNTNVCIIQKPCFKPKLSNIYYKIKKNKKIWSYIYSDVMLLHHSDKRLKKSKNYLSRAEDLVPEYYSQSQ